MLPGGTLYLWQTGCLNTNPNVAVRRRRNSTTAAGTLYLAAPQTFGSLSGSGVVNLQGNALTLTGSSTFTGTIKDTNNSATQGVTLAPPTNATQPVMLPIPLGTSDTYTGPTVIDGPEGVLQVNGTLTASAVTVNSGGTLEGSGTITKAVSVSTGGWIIPGATGLGSTGVLSTGPLSLPAGSNFDVQLAGGTEGQYDELNVNGAVTLGGNLNRARSAASCPPPTSRS